MTKDGTTGSAGSIVPAAGPIPVRPGLKRPGPHLPKPHLRQGARELRAPRATVAASQLVEHEPAGVVSRALVPASGVSEPHDKEIQRRGPVAPTEDAHLALGGALLAGCLPAGLGRRLGGALRCLLALRHLHSLGQLAL